MFSSIAIELNVPRDESSSIDRHLETRFKKKADSVLFDIGDTWECHNEFFFFFFNPIT